MRGEGWRLTEASSLGLLFCHGRGQLRFLLLCLGGSPDSRGSQGNCDGKEGSSCRVEEQARVSSGMFLG